MNRCIALLALLALLALAFLAGRYSPARYAITFNPEEARLMVEEGATFPITVAPGVVVDVDVR